MRAGAALVISALLAAAGASADLLVTLDGTTLETEGPWSIDGKLVVFHLPGGRLTSLRVNRVDLEASAAATAAQRETSSQEAAPKQSQPAEAVLTLTDGDVRHVAPETQEALAGSEPGREGR